jgi:hypothetical protein
MTYTFIPVFKPALDDELLLDEPQAASSVTVAATVSVAAALKRVRLGPLPERE